MTAVAFQPETITMSDRLAVRVPITDFREASRMTTATRGRATTPLITALQNRAFIGLTGDYRMTSPAGTLLAMTP